MNRIRLRFNKSTDRLTREYRVYRSIRPGTDRSSLMLLRARHSLQVTPVEVSGEISEKIASNTFKLKYYDILPAYPLAFALDGVFLTADEYALDAANAIVTVIDKEGDSLIADYWFDGVEIIDDGVKRPVIIEMLAPGAQHMLRPLTPEDITFEVAPGDVTAQLGYQPSIVESSTFYYRVEAINSVGDISPLSPELSIELGEEVGSYQVEYSLDYGASWAVDGESEELEYTVSRLDRRPPEAAELVSSEVTQTSATTASVEIIWETPLLNSLSNESPLYRVLAKTRTGILSLPSPAVGGVTVKTDLDKVVIRRRVYDATYPQYGDASSITVATITDLETDSFTDLIQRYAEYAYSIFVVDKAGNPSLATTFTAKSIDLS